VTNPPRFKVAFPNGGDSLIGPEYRNRWWENLFMFIWSAFAIYGATQSVRSIMGHYGG